MSAGSVMKGDKGNVAKRCQESLGEFAAKLYAQLYKEKGNIFISPLSIAACLQMVYHGSGGRTKEQAAEAMGILGIEDGDVLEFYRDLIGELRKANTDNVTLTLANKVWIKEDFPVLDSYRNTLVESFDAELARDPFTDANATAKDVNSWVDGRTKGMIQQLIDPGMVTPLTRLILCNAVYFLGLWQIPFSRTKDEEFHLSAKETRNVPMMSLDGNKKFRYGETETARYVLLPYKGDRSLSMMVILPQMPFKLGAVEEEIVKPGTIASWYNNTSMRDVNLKLPKFKMEEKYDLKKILQQMGIGDMFSCSEADFSSINGDGGLYISHAIHKTALIVDESGTEAAAATAMIANFCMAFEPEEPVEFLVDQPFLLSVVRVFPPDSRKWRVNPLFIGRCVTPEC